MTAAAKPGFVPGAIRALVFDVFGTVVDWRTSIIREGQALEVRLGGPASALSGVDWPALADAWRAGYPPAMDEVRRGLLPWTTIDGLHRRILDRILAERGIQLDVAEAADFNRVWHRLMPWPEVVAGLHQLKERYIISTLSNGNLSLLVDMAKHGGLPWDCVLSAELFKHYKPDPEVYLGAAHILDLEPAQVLMVAAHPSDLRAAATTGLRTAYVDRPLEYGPGVPREPYRVGEFDIEVAGFGELAQRLG